MIYYALILIFFALAGMCNAIMDTLDHHHDKSIFSKFKRNTMWWNFHEGWRNKYIDRDPKKGRVKWIGNINKPVQITDAWHFFKMLMIVFAAASVVIALLNPHVMYLVKFSDSWNYIANVILHMLVMGSVRNLTFSLFYNRLLIIS